MGIGRVICQVNVMGTKDSRGQDRGTFRGEMQLLEEGAPVGAACFPVDARSLRDAGLNSSGAHPDVRVPGGPWQGVLTPSSASPSPSRL